MFQANFKKWPPTAIADNIFGSFMMAHKKFPCWPIFLKSGNSDIRGMFQANSKKWQQTVITDNIFGSFMIAHKKFPCRPIFLKSGNP